MKSDFLSPETRMISQPPALEKCGSRDLLSRRVTGQTPIGTARYDAWH